MEQYPDELRTRTPAEKPGCGPLGDFLWETASWDPAVEGLVHEALQDGTERELVIVARRLLDERRLTEPSRIVRLVRLLADAGGLDPGQLPPAGGGAAGPPQGPSQSPDLDPLGAGLPLLGRETELVGAGRVKDRWPAGVSLVCVTGPPGAGKTRLAREIAASLNQGRPGRLLRVRLSQGAPGSEDRLLATTPYEALAELLAQLGVLRAEIPATLDGRRARYAAELTDPYPVILLDGVVHEHQVPALLPLSPGCVVLTSRSPLTGLNDLGAQFVPLGRLAGDWPRRLVRRVFQAHGVEPDDLAAAAIARWSDGLPGPAILLARCVAVTAKAKGLAPGAVTGQIEAAPDADMMAAVVGLLDVNQRAVLRTLAALRLPRADLHALSLSTGLSHDRVAAALAGLAELGLVGEDERDGTWVIDSLTADRVRTRARAAGQLTGDSYEQLIGPVIGLFALRARALRDLLAETEPEMGAALRAWALRQWQAEQPGLAAVLQAAAAAPRPALARLLAAAFTDAAAAAGAASGAFESEASVTAVALIARDADDQRLEDRALTWLKRQDTLLDAGGPEPVRSAVTRSGPADIPAPPDALPVERSVGPELNAVPSGPVLFGAGDRWS
jgi:DNA-binding transcriptional ArsR family regulator